jgi:polyhydroxybutyrate depolymerase
MIMISNKNNQGAEYDPVDPLNPYIPPVSGLFPEQTADTKDYFGQYMVYIPTNFQLSNATVMILSQEGITSKEFYQTRTGMEWKALSDQQGFVLVIAEPQDGKNWNLSGDPALRDDITFLKRVYDTISSKSKQIRAVFNFNERAFYMVGYEDGGTMAHEFAMAWPYIFCGVATIGGAAVPSKVLDILGNSFNDPLSNGSLLALNMKSRLQNKNIPVPMWIVEASDESKNSQEVISYWISANNAIHTESNNYTQAAYENNAARVWVTDSTAGMKLTPDILYTQFLSKVQRFAGNPGGRLEWTVKHVNNGRTGFFTTEMIIDGLTRRWLTYVPTNYQQGKKVSLVVAIHGFTSAMTAFTGDTRWWEVAEKKGFIVVFGQAYPSDDILGNMPVPYWYSPLQAEVMGLSPKNPPDDVSYFSKIVEITKEQYSIDSSRVYATGHSNGSCMTWMLAAEVPELFAAVAPVGGDYGTNYDTMPENRQPIPIWIMKGEYDIDFGAYTQKAIDYWTMYNGITETPKESVDATGRFLTNDYLNDDKAPLFRSTIVANSPHAYLPEQAEMIWNDFFSKFTLNEDGSRSYDFI